MIIYTEGLEGTTISLTNCGSDSNEKLLIRRDLDLKGLDTAADNNTKTIDITLTAAKDIVYFLLGNLTSNTDTTIKTYYDDGGWTLRETVAAATYTNDNLLITQDLVNATQFKVDFEGTSFSIDLACVLMGTAYTFPVNYQYHNNRISMMRNAVQYDQRGYPYAHTINSSTKYIWDVNFKMTEAQLETLITQMEYIRYNARPFFLYDSIVDTNYHLCFFPDNQLTAINQAAGYFEVNFKAIEL